MFVIVLDWDGTVTEVDTLDLVLRRFGDAEVYRRAEDDLTAGRATLNEVIAAEFAGVRAPLEEVVRWLLDHARIRRGFRQFAERRRPLIVSSGFHELIEPLLAREGLGWLEVRANMLDARADGWRVRFRADTPCGACGEPCKRADLPPAPVVLVGDGYSDRCAALAADRVFARDGLARYLAERGVAFDSFEDFEELDRRLDEAAGPVEPATSPAAPTPAS